MSTIINQNVNKLETIVDTTVNLIETSIFTNSTSINVNINDGRIGESAYEIAVHNGFIGTEQDWLNSLGNSGPIHEVDIVDLDKYTQLEVDNFLADKFDNPVGNNTQYLDGAGAPTTFPTIPLSQINSDWNATTGVAEILNKPTIPSISGLATQSYVDSQDALKVDKVSGKSLILDSEITRLSTVINFDNSGNVNSLANKVDKITGYSLTKNDLTDVLKTTYDNAVSSLATLLSTGLRLITSGEITKLSNTSGTNTGDQDLSKFPKILASKGTYGTSITGTVSETILEQFTIPVGELINGNIVDIKTHFYTSGTNPFRYRISNTNSLATATQIAISPNATNNWTSMSRKLFVLNNGIEVYNSTYATYDDVVIAPNTYYNRTAITIDLTLPIYVFITGTLASQYGNNRSIGYSAIKY